MGGYTWAYLLIPSFLFFTVVPSFTYGELVMKIYTQQAISIFYMLQQKRLIAIRSAKQ